MYRLEGEDCYVLMDGYWVPEYLEDVVYSSIIEREINHDY